MSGLDLAFLAFFVIALTGILVSSPVLRAGLWDTLRHPFTHAVVEVHGDRVEVRHIVKTEQDIPASIPRMDKSKPQSRV